MVKANDIKKVEALKLREAGDTIRQIVTKTGLSKSTLLKYFKKKGVIKSVATLPVIKNDTPINNPTPKGEKSDIINNNDTLSDTKEITPPFDNVNISFNNDGGITLTSLDTPIPHDPITPKAVEPKESAGVQPGISAEDSYFGKLLPEGLKMPGSEEKSGVLGYAIPIGLLLVGAYLMKTQPDVNTNTNVYRGGEIRKHGLSWLEQGEDKW